MVSVTGAERIAPAVCAIGVVAEFLCGYAGYFVVNRIWPGFYYNSDRREEVDLARTSGSVHHDLCRRRPMRVWRPQARHVCDGVTHASGGATRLNEDLVTRTCGRGHERPHLSDF